MQLLVECKEYLKVSSAGGKKDFLSFGTFIVFCKKQVRDQRLFAVNMLPHCLAVPRTVMLWPSLGHLVPSRGDSPLFNPLNLISVIVQPAPAAYSVGLCTQTCVPVKPQLNDCGCL